MDEWRRYSSDIRRKLELLQRLEAITKCIEKPLAQHVSEAENQCVEVVERSIDESPLIEVHTTLEEWTLRSQKHEEQMQQQALDEELRLSNLILCSIKDLFVATPRNNDYDRYLEGFDMLFEEVSDHDMRISYDHKVFDEMTSSKIAVNFQVYSFLLGFDYLLLPSQYFGLLLWSTGIGIVRLFIDSAIDGVSCYVMRDDINDKFGSYFGTEFKLLTDLECRCPRNYGLLLFRKQWILMLQLLGNTFLDDLIDTEGDCGAVVGLSFSFLNWEGLKIYGQNYRLSGIYVLFTFSSHFSNLSLGYKPVFSKIHTGTWIVLVILDKLPSFLVQHWPWEVAALLYDISPVDISDSVEYCTFSGIKVVVKLSLPETVLTIHLLFLSLRVLSDKVDPIHVSLFIQWLNICVKNSWVAFLITKRYENNYLDVIGVLVIEYNFRSGICSFDEMLGMFLQLFIKPLISTNATSRENRILNSPYEAGKLSYAWKMLQLNKYLRVEDYHSHAFNCKFDLVKFSSLKSIYEEIEVFFFRNGIGIIHEILVDIVKYTQVSSIAYLPNIDGDLHNDQLSNYSILWVEGLKEVIFEKWEVINHTQFNYKPSFLNFVGSFHVMLEASVEHGNSLVFLPMLFLGGSVSSIKAQQGVNTSQGSFYSYDEHEVCACYLPQFWKEAVLKIANSESLSWVMFSVVVQTPYIIHDLDTLLLLEVCLSIWIGEFLLTIYAQNQNQVLAFRKKVLIAWLVISLYHLETFKNHYVIAEVIAQPKSDSHQHQLAFWSFNIIACGNVRGDNNSVDVFVIDEQIEIFIPPLFRNKEIYRLLNYVIQNCFHKCLEDGGKLTDCIFLHLQLGSLVVLHECSNAIYSVQRTNLWTEDNDFAVSLWIREDTNHLKGKVVIQVE